MSWGGYRDQMKDEMKSGGVSDTHRMPDPSKGLIPLLFSRFEFDAIKSAVEEIRKLFSVGTIPIHTLNNSRWELKNDLLVAVEQRGEDDFVACLYDVKIYGYGNTIPESLQDLKEAIINQYEYLLSKKDKIKFGAEVEQQYSFLMRIIKKNED